MTKEDTLLLIQIDGQTNWTKEKSDLNESRIGEYSGTVKKGLPHGQGQLCYSHGGKYIGSWKDGKKDGTWTSWWDYDKTRKEMQGSYKSGKMVDKWYFYNNKGNLKEIRYFSPVF